MEVGTIQRLPQEIVEGFKGLCTSTIGNVLDDMKIQGLSPISNPCTMAFPAWAAR